MENLKVERSEFTDSLVILRIIVLILTTLLGSGAHALADSASLNDLIKQVEGRSCPYMADHTFTDQDSRCKKRPFYYLPVLKGAPSRHVCLYWAAKCLGDMGTEAQPAVPALLKALREGPNDYDTGDGTIGTRSTVAWALGRIGDPSAIPGLVEAVEHAKPSDRYSGENADSHSVAARGAIAQALGSFGSQARSAAPSFMKMLQDGKSGVNSDLEIAALALGQIGAKEAIPLLIDLLARRDRTAIRAAEALGLLGPDARSAVIPLTDILLSENCGHLLRWRAATSLGKIGDPRSVPALGQVLRNPKLAQPAVEALMIFGADASTVIADLIALLKKPSGSTIDPITGAIHYTGESGSLHSARVVVVGLLEKINTHEAFDALVSVLQDPELANTVVVIPALLRMDLDEAKKVFLKLIYSDDLVGRWVGARGLGELRAPEIIPELILLLKDENCRVRDAAIRALCAHGSDASVALPALKEIDSAGDKCTPRLVEKAIRRIGKNPK